jgi:hypothetical protein
LGIADFLLGRVQTCTLNLHAQEGGRAETLTLNNKWSGRGQSGSFSKVYLLEPSAPPQVIMTLESKREVRIQSETIEPAGRARLI